MYVAVCLAPIGVVWTASAARCAMAANRSPVTTALDLSTDDVRATPTRR